MSVKKCNRKKRKQQKNSMGLTKQEENKFKKEFTFGQVETAEILGVAPTTISRWCRLGLPHKRGKPGLEHQIELRTVIFWSQGHKAANEHGLELDALEKILWALAMQEVALNKHANFYKWELGMLNEFDWFAVTRDKLIFAIGRLSAFDCFTFREKRW